jgi:hypothetical protein
MVVEAIHPFEEGIFDRLEIAPWATTMDGFGPEKPVDRLSQRVVIAVTGAAHICQSLGAFDRQRLDVFNRSPTEYRSTRPESLPEWATT